MAFGHDGGIVTSGRGRAPPLRTFFRRSFRRGRCPHRPAVFASYSGRAEPRTYTRSDVPCERPLPLPLGEVAERSEDGEGKP